MTQTLLSPLEAAEQLRISERTLRDLKRRGAIRYVALTNRRIAYRLDDLADFIANRVRCDEQSEAAPPSKRRVNVSGTARNVVPFSEILRRP